MTMKKQCSGTAWTALSASLAVCLFQALSAARAQVSVTPSITTNLGITTFDYAIANGAANDLAIVTIGVPAFPGAVFDLETPAGFMSSFDSGLGLVDFLAD